MTALRVLNPPTRIAITTIVTIPIGPEATNKVSAQPVEMLKNCFMACSPKSVNRGKTAVPTLLNRSVKSLTGWAAAGMGAAVVVVAGAMFHEHYLARWKYLRSANGGSS